MSADTVRTDLAVYIAMNTQHDLFNTWLKGKGPDEAMKAMDKSQFSKKPGRVVERLMKPLDRFFQTPRVVRWDKEMKVVYAPAFTAGKASDVLEVPDERKAGLDVASVFITDLYFRSNGKVTELNASTVAGITEAAAMKVIGDDLDGPDAINTEIRKCLTIGRIFHTGLKDAGFEPEQIVDFVLPFGDAMALEVTALPIERTEFEQATKGQVLLIRDVTSRAGLDEKRNGLLTRLQSALTKDGHPGAEAFAQLVREAVKV